MTAEATFPAPPPELREAGKVLWNAVGDDELELRPDELAVSPRLARRGTSSPRWSRQPPPRRR
jgi:hypothetical protein